jgi:NAD(P)H-dependent flavin oxidoreductase YrpB (nitropropane dioxygenase family)
VVTTALDGVPQRLLRTEFVDVLERSGPLRRLVRAARSAAAFRRETGLRWRDLVAEGWAMRRSRGLSLSQVLLAANTPALLRATMVDGRADVGVMATGQVVGLIDDLPSCAELIERIMREASEVLHRLADASRPDRVDRPDDGDREPM